MCVVCYKRNDAEKQRDRERERERETGTLSVCLSAGLSFLHGRVLRLAYAVASRRGAEVPQ